MSKVAPEIKWDYPTPFTLCLTPLADDIDGLQHTNNAVYVRWCEQVAWAHSEKLGLSLTDYQYLNRAMAIRRSEYDYLHPAMLGDEVTIATWLTGSDGKLMLKRHFQLVRPADGATLMRGRWELVCIELDSGKPRRMPAEFSGIYLPAIIAPAA